MASNSNNVTRLTTEAELRAVMTEVFVNTTQAVTKVNDDSVIQGVIAGSAKVAKKALKDIALAASHQFPDTAFGTTLDTVAENNGIAPRFGASQSSTWLRVKANPGTIYTAGIHTFSGKNGIVFDVEQTKTIGTKGYDYIKVRSQSTGFITNVDPYTIANVSPIPSGHIGVINEFAAVGGRDIEDDSLLRQRIKQGADGLSRGTLSYLTQAALKANPNVLKINFEGVDTTGKTILSVVSQNGIDFTTNELDVILQGIIPYLSLTELNPIGTSSYGVMLKNIEYFMIDVEFRIGLFDTFTFTDVVKEIQFKFNKLVDFRFWSSTKNNIKWQDLLFAVKNTKGVKSVPDTYFSPNIDIKVPSNKLPRFRGFVVRDINGNIQINQSGTINPIYYQDLIDPSFALTVL
jgi:hypothetical protein